MSQRLVTGNGGTRPVAGRSPLRVSIFFFLALAFASAAPALADRLVALRVGSGFDYPVFATSPPNDDRVFVVEQAGVIKILGDPSPSQTPFLDIQSLVYPPSPYEERGLLGLAFHPDYAHNGYFYVNYNDLNWNTVIARYSVSSDPNVADPESAVIIMTIEQNGPNHKGGTLLFGPNDGYLYIGMGDGGGEGDPLNNAQRDDTLLGKMLRIDVDKGIPYAIPPDNPYAGPGLPLDEIWAKGFRNPYRWSFDRDTGDLYIGDVGQRLWEEIDYQPASSPGGENYGWRLMEGNHCYEPPEGCNPDTLVTPIHEYQHIYNCAVIGGYVYRGKAIPMLRGTYFFADYCTARIWSFRYGHGQVTEFTDHTDELSPHGEIALISSLGEDAQGELYVVARGTPGNGEVYKIVPGPSATPESERKSVLPASLRLMGADPNPFTRSTRVSIAITGRPDHFAAAVYSPAGRLVDRLAPVFEANGTLTLDWDGRDGQGAICPSGMYYLRVEADGVTAKERLILIH